MRYQGRVTDWKDERGFGFVTPDGGGPHVFIHIKSFLNRQRRPAVNELVTYEIASDARGRSQGVNIAFAGDRSTYPVTTVPGPGVTALLFATAFLGFVAGTVATGMAPFLVLIVYLTVSCAAYVAYALDKVASLKGKWRTSESTLHLFSLFGGWPGAMLAQRMLRHKTRKKSFQVTYWVTVLLNCAAFCWLLTPSGFRTITSWIGVG